MLLLIYKKFLAKKYLLNSYLFSWSLKIKNAYISYSLVIFSIGILYTILHCIWYDVFYNLDIIFLAAYTFLLLILLINISLVIRLFFIIHTSNNYIFILNKSKNKRLILIFYYFWKYLCILLGGIIIFITLSDANTDSGTWTHTSLFISF